MFKRFSTNYMAGLFLLDVLIVQVALRIAMQLRLTLGIGPFVYPQWDLLYDYGLPLIVGILWIVSFLSFSIYVPRIDRPLVR